MDNPHPAGIFTYKTQPYTSTRGAGREVLRAVYCVTLRWTLWMLGFGFLLSGCAKPPERAFQGEERACIQNYEPGKDYFDNKVQTQYAENFSVRYEKFYKVVTVRRPIAEGPAETYVLVQCGAPSPALAGDLANAETVSVPVQSVFSGSLTHLQLLVDLGHVQALSGVAERRFVTTPAVIDWIQKGNVTEFAPNNTTDVEVVIASAPDLFMTGGENSGELQSIRKAGISVVENSEWQETSPLGRAEWIKYMALFLNEEAKANTIFNGVRDRYLELRRRAEAISEEDRPQVMTGNMYRGVFEVAGGRSYVAALIRDAGGAYVWADNDSTGFFAVDFEAQYARAADARFWINGLDWHSRRGMLNEESRYEKFRAFQEGNVWLYNRVVNQDGGNDYWSRSVTRPDLILGDLLKIFHPALAKDHELVWYKQVPSEERG